MDAKVKLISYVKIRQLIGWLGILLPIAMLLESTLYCESSIRQSISHYYYSNLGDVFVGVLTALAVFLYSYRGYEKEKDNQLTNLTALGALGVAYFPTDGVEKGQWGDCSGIIPKIVSHYIHLASACLFFLTLAILLLYFFTRTSKGKLISKQKKLRNKIYTICGITMLVCFGWIVIVSFWGNEHLFWQEFIALIAFGFAWLVKGELLLKDKI
ncbi:hypothetical protein [Flectobacillus longus]|uniref:hypothetical protein n=1 Tax=Flectobacillus longus TaxID=2984207 RepID=UPI0024B643F9|nr:hypothetical protein [Flectobacillus longus]MDI9882753.1 hypothetical protein [Flectobacillus longus]